MRGLSTILGKNANIITSGTILLERDKMTDLNDVNSLVLPFNEKARLLVISLGAKRTKRIQGFSHDLVTMLKADVTKNELGCSSQKSPRTIRTVRAALHWAKQFLDQAQIDPEIDWSILERHPAFRMIEGPEQEIEASLQRLKEYLETYFGVYDYKTLNDIVSRWSKIKELYLAYRTIVRDEQNKHLLRALITASGAVGERLSLHEQAGLELVRWGTPIDIPTFIDLP